MRKTKTYNWEQIAANVDSWLSKNSLYNKRMTTSEIIDKFRECGFSEISRFMSVLVDNVFIHCEKGKGCAKMYYFTEPIYRTRFKNIMSVAFANYKAKEKAYNKAYLAKKVNEAGKKEGSVKEFTHEQAIAEAIKLLKNDGNYIIQKKVVTWEEV